jgi:hypothetical protein
MTDDVGFLVRAAEEVSMNEVFPVMAGVLVGLIAMRIASVQLRAVAVVVLGVIFGVAASAISGELAISWEFILVDIPLVIATAVATVFAARRVFVSHPRI